MADKTILIADSGSTKTAWCLLCGEERKHFETQGMSPYFLKEEDIRSLLEKELNLPVSTTAIRQIFFYGTGLSVSEKAQSMKKVLSAAFDRATVEVNHDLAGAARALCQHEEGLACILGTGSGACYYDGTIIRKISPGLGFILGDEGSGAYLGKMLVQKYLYKDLDKVLIRNFEKKYQTGKPEILKKVYQEPFPNRYLASFARFLGQNRGNEEVEAIIETGIKDFLTVHIEKYEESHRLPVHFVGGVANAFPDVVERLCIEQGLHPGRILKEPMEGLVKFHEE